MTEDNNIALFTLPDGRNNELHFLHAKTPKRSRMGNNGFHLHRNAYHTLNKPVHDYCC